MQNFRPGVLFFHILFLLGCRDKRCLSEQLHDVYILTFLSPLLIIEIKDLIGQSPFPPLWNGPYIISKALIWAWSCLHFCGSYFCRNAYRKLERKVLHSNTLPYWIKALFFLQFKKGWRKEWCLCCSKIKDKIVFSLAHMFWSWEHTMQSVKSLFNR